MNPPLANTPSVRGGRPPDTRDRAIVRFWSYVDQRAPDECWPWKGARVSYGYGNFCYQGRYVGAHRFSYELASGGPIEAGKFVMHSCDNPACVNPAHLSVGTNADNMRDMAAKGRAPGQRQTHCVRGHPFNEANTRLAARADGRPIRVCRTCDSAKSMRWQAKKAGRAT